MARDGAQSPLQVGACPGYEGALMATKQQLKSQLDSLRSENQRLEELVDDLRTENPERMRMAETEGAYDDAMKQLEALQQENSALRERLAREQTADKEEEIASLSRQLREVIQEAEASERRAQTAETENERMAEIVDRMEERANTAEMEVKRLREEQSHEELERLRAMAAQQAKWEAREQRLEAQLVATERRVQEMSDRTVRRDWETEELAHTPELQPPADDLPRREPEYELLQPREGPLHCDERKSPPPLVHYQTPGLRRELEQFPQTAAGVPVTGQQMPGLRRELEQFPQTAAGVPVTGQQMPGLRRELEQFPQTAAGVPVTAQQMPGLRRELEQFPQTAAGVPVTAQQMPGLRRELEQFPQTAAGVPVTGQQMPGLRRELEQFPQTAAGVPVTAQQMPGLRRELEQFPQTAAGVPVTGQQMPGLRRELEQFPQTAAGVLVTAQQMPGLRRELEQFPQTAAGVPVTGQQMPGLRRELEQFPQTAAGVPVTAQQMPGLRRELEQFPQTAAGVPVTGQQMPGLRRELEQIAQTAAGVPVTAQQMPGLRRELEQFPQTAAGVPVTAQQMPGLRRELEQFPQTAAGVPVTAQQMPGLRRELEQFPQTAAGVPVTAQQMPGLRRELEQFPQTAAGVPVTAQQMPGLRRELEQFPQTAAGDRVRMAPAQGSGPLQRGAKPMVPTCNYMCLYGEATTSDRWPTSTVPLTATPIVTPSVITSTAVPLPVTSPQTPNQPRGEQLGQSQPKCELTAALGNLTQQLPPLPMFSGDDPVRDSGTFQEWLDQFEMVGELAQWSDGVKLKQLVLRLRGSARAFYRTLTEEQKWNYQSLVQELKNRFTPVRIQALESSIFRERRQKVEESVDAYAQDLQQLFQKAYPTALQGSEDARVMGQSVLSNQLIAGLLPELKRKIAYIEGATFSELWQKARFEEARLLDLARTGTRPAAMPWKQRFPRDDAPKQEQWKQQPPQGNLQRQERSSLSLAGGRTGDGQRRNPQFVKCYNCNRTGHLARDCRSVRPVGEAPARTQNPKASNWNAATRAAAVVSVPGECQSRGEEEPLKWMYEMYGLLHTDAPPADSCLRLGPTLTLPLELDGIPVQALVDTGCPATIISREICRKILDKEREEAEPLTSEQWKEKAAKRLRQPGLLLKAYCGTELNIGAEIAVHVATPHHAVNRVVLVQKDTPVHMLLGTDLMSALGIRVLDSNGQSLLVPLMEQPQPVGAVKQPQPVQVVEQPQPVGVVEQPQPVQVVEQPPPVQVVEQPPPVQVVEQPQPVGVVEQPQPVQVVEQPPPVGAVEQPQFYH